MLALSARDFLTAIISIRPNVTNIAMLVSCRPGKFLPLRTAGVEIGSADQPGPASRIVATLTAYRYQAGYPVKGRSIANRYY